MNELLNMSAKEYYQQTCDVDVSKLPIGVCDMIASLFLEGNYFKEEELKQIFEQHKIQWSNQELSE